MLDGAGRADIGAGAAFDALFGVDLIRSAFANRTRRAFRLASSARNTGIFDSISHDILLHLNLFP